MAPLLWMGMTFASLSCVGKLPVSNDELIMSERMTLKIEILFAAALSAHIFVSDVDLFFSAFIIL